MREEGYRWSETATVNANKHPESTEDRPTLLVLPWWAVWDWAWRALEGIVSDITPFNLVCVVVPECGGDFKVRLVIPGQRVGNKHARFGAPR